MGRIVLKKKMPDEKRCICCGEELEDRKKLCIKCERRLQGLDEHEGWIKEWRKEHIEEYYNRNIFLEPLKWNDTTD